MTLAAGFGATGDIVAGATGAFVGDVVVVVVTGMTGVTVAAGVDF